MAPRTLARLSRLLLGYAAASLTLNGLVYLSHAPLFSVKPPTGYLLFVMHAVSGFTLLTDRSLPAVLRALALPVTLITTLLIALAWVALPAYKYLALQQQDGLMVGLLVCWHLLGLGLNVSVVGIGVAANRKRTIRRPLRGKKGPFKVD